MADPKLSIDEEEFSRMQMQLLQLREENYQLKDLSERQNTELQAQTKELDKVRRVIQKTKKGKDIQALLDENEKFQQKVETQEQEFKLQNETMMKEVNELSTSKDKLQKEILHLKAKLAEEDLGDRERSIDIHMRAELAALKKSLQDNLDAEVGEISNETLRVKLSTAEEEIVILHTKLKEEKERHDAAILQLKEERNEVLEKLRRKQESIIQLQKEKEELVIEKEKAHDESRKVYQSQIETLSRQIIDIQEHSLSNDTSTEQSKLEVEEELANERQIHAKLQLQFQEEVLALRDENDTLQRQLKDLTELSERRKQTINEMSAKQHESSLEHRTKLQKVEEEWKLVTSNLKSELDSAKETASRLHVEKEQLKTQVSGTQQLLEEISGLNKELDKEKLSYSEEKEKWVSDMENMHQSHSEEMKELESKLEIAKREADLLTEELYSLKQALKDKDQEVLIIERKNANQLKDLKRHLLQSQKREENLKNELSETRAARVISELEEPKNKTDREDRLSFQREDSYSNVGTPSNSFNDSSSIESESVDANIQELLARITKLQKEKWELEERVNHLEMNNAAFAEDILQKSALIEHYFMRNKADHSTPLQDPSENSPHVRSSRSVVGKMSPMKLVQKISAGAELDRAKDINGKLQRSLEEALMKNISLQQNMESLLKELEEMKKKTQPDPQLECASDP